MRPGRSTIRIREAGAEEGIAFAFERMPRTPNTFASHRVVHYAAGEGVQNETVEALFEAAFLSGRDIGDRESLLDIGAECGLEPVALSEYLASAADVDALRAEEARSRRMGVTGVPFFIIGGRYGVSGAQDPAVLRSVIDKVAGGVAGMTVEVRDPRFHEVVGDDAPMERLGTGFAFTEGPVWHPVERHLIFSDMPGDHMRRWSEADGVTTFRQPANKANGNAYDPAGRLVTCEHATSRVTRTEPDGTLTVLATHWEGRELNSPNDIVVRRDGAILLHRSELRAARVLRRAAGAGARLPGGVPHRAGRDSDPPRGRLRPAERALLRRPGGAALRQRHRGRAHPGVRRRGGRRRHRGRGLGGGDGRRRRRPGRHEDRLRGQRLLHRPRRGPRVRSGRDVSRGHPGAGGPSPTSRGATRTCGAFFLTASTSLYRTRVRIPGRPAF